MKLYLSSVVILVVLLTLTMQGANTVSTESTPFTSTMVSSTEDTNNETIVSSTTDGSTTLLMSTTTEFMTSLPTTSDFTTSETTTIDIPTSQTTIEDFTTSDTSTIEFTTSFTISETITVDSTTSSSTPEDFTSSDASTTEFTTSPPTSINFTISEPATTSFDTSQSTTNAFTTSDPSTDQFTTSLPTTNEFTPVETTNNDVKTTIIQSTTNNIPTTSSKPSDASIYKDVTIGLSVCLGVVTIAGIIFFVYPRLDRSKKHKDIENDPDDETKSKKSSIIDIGETQKPDSPDTAATTSRMDTYAVNSMLVQKHCQTDKQVCKSVRTETSEPGKKLEKQQTSTCYLFANPKSATLPETTDVECQTDIVEVNIILVSNHCQTDKSRCISVQTQTEPPKPGKELVKRQTEIFYLPPNPKPSTRVSTSSHTSTSIPETIDAERCISVQTQTEPPKPGKELVKRQTEIVYLPPNPKPSTHVSTSSQTSTSIPEKIDAESQMTDKPIPRPTPKPKRNLQMVSYSRYSFLYKIALHELLTPNRQTNGLETLQTSQCHCKLPIGKAKWQLRRIAPNL